MPLRLPSGSQNKRTPATRRPRLPGSTLDSPLRNRSFRRLFIASLGDGVGDDAVRSLLPVIAVGLLGATAIQTSVLNALGMAAFLLLGVPIGVLVDRWPKKTCLIGANLVRAVAVLTIPIAYFTGTLHLWHLLVVAGVVSVADVVFTTAHSALLPRLLRGPQLGDGFALLQSAQSGVAIAAPGLAGLLLKVIAAPAILLGAGTAYLISAAVTSRLPADQPTSATPTDRFWSQARDGLGYTLRHPLLRTLMSAVALINAAGMFGLAAKIIFALDTLQIPLAQFVILGAFSAAGGLLAALTATRITRQVGIGRTKILASLLSAASVILLPAAPLLGLQPVVWIGLSGVGWAFFVVLSGLAGAGILPRLIPQHLMGRVLSTYRLVTLGIMPLASLASGELAAMTGIIPVLWVWAIIAAASAIPLLASPIRSWKQFPAELDIHTVQT